jgi:hypothetical protein
VSGTRRGILYVTAVVAVAIPPSVWLASQLLATPHVPVVVPLALTGAKPTVTDASPKLDANPKDYLSLAQRDPLALVHLGRERFERDVRDYRCVLLKQELLGDELTPVQEVEVRIRQAPRAIFMLWQQNATQVKRALYKDEAAFVNADGQQVARIEPAGAIIRLITTDVLMPIKGEQARKTSRRSIDECGFSTSFELTERYAQLARQNGVLDVKYGGTGEVDGRPTFVIVRHLPYTGEGGQYPDAKTVVHLDQEWLLPVAIESYADHEGTQLLGRYVFTHVELNPGLGEADFQF